MNPNQNPDFIKNFGPRERMEYDVLIVGAGPAGLSAAIRLKQLSKKNQKELSVCVIEKGSEPGAHILSGAVFDPITLNELLPNWRHLEAPIYTPVTEDRFLFLTKNMALKTPNFILPNCLKNKGNYIVSLANFVRWLAKQAEELDVEIFSGFTAAEIIYENNTSVIGVATGNQGIDANGEANKDFQMGVEIVAKYTFFAEGARGHLGKELINKFNLNSKSDPQIYSIGLKELWEVNSQKYKQGLVVHTAGWPLENNTYGGSFLYNLENNQIAIGYVIGLSYQNPFLSPFDEFQRFKTHPYIKAFLEGGKRIAYGARAITNGGLQALPKLIFPGGALIGCNAGFLNSSRIKGSHTAMKSGILAADAAFEAILSNRKRDKLHSFVKNFESSWLYKELYISRNFKPLMNKGLLVGTFFFGIDQILFRGKAIWTFHEKKSDHSRLKAISNYKPISYPKPDGIITFDKLSSVFISNTNHKENQPSHLLIKNPDIMIKQNLKIYGGPETRYCPAGVYEYLNLNGEYKLQINSQNCVHCKTCDIKDPNQNIIWVPPVGGDGPNYPNM